VAADLPPGYRLVRSGRALVAVRAPALDRVRDAVAVAGTLYAFARAHAVAELTGGRGRVPVLEVAGDAWAVRHYRRGGAAAALLGDRYLRGPTPRPFAELAVSAALRAAGVATPEVHAAVVYPAGPWYRADLATAFVPDADDLATLTLGAAPREPADRVRAWQAAGRLLATFFATGAVHRDLNLRNVLITRAGNAWLLDLDRCAPPGRPEQAARDRMLARFHRSRRKLEDRAGRSVGTAELASFERELAA
jgi:3-deoxy-D-manno-octulosonic acid kinase